MRESEEINLVEDLRVNGWMILRGSLKIVWIWTVLIWSRKGTSGVTGSTVVILQVP
jgi:hypothetical protein